MNIGRISRAVGTAISFSTFGVGGLFIGLFIAPCLVIFIRDRSKRQKTARQFISFCFRAFIGIMKGLGVLDYETHNIHRLHRPGLLILANHPSLIDVIFLLAYTPNADCVVKGRLASNPFTRGPIRAAGYITNREPEAVLEAAKDSLGQGQSLILFPEGTRTVPGRPIKFRRGGANIALRTGTLITPVLFRCTPPTLARGEPWYHIPPKKVTIVLSVLEDLTPDNNELMPTSQAARQLTRRLSDHFNRELEKFDDAGHSKSVA